MKQYVYIGAVLAALYGAVLLTNNVTGCQKEKTKQGAIENPAKNEVVVERKVTTTVTKPDGTKEETNETTKETRTDIKPVIPETHAEASQPAGRKSVYLSATAGYGAGNLVTENYGCGAGVFLTESIAVGARIDHIGGETRYAAEIVLTF